MTSKRGINLLGLQRPALAHLDSFRSFYKKHDTHDLQTENIVEYGGEGGGKDGGNDGEDETGKCNTTSLKQRNGDILTETQIEVMNTPTHEETTHDFETMLVSQDSSDHPDIYKDTYPDGGFEAYLVVFGAFCGTFVIFGFFNSTGAIQAYLSEHTLRDQPVSTIGWVFSLYCFFTLGGAIISGPVFDSKGSKVPCYIGSVLIILGFFTMAESSTVYQFILSFGVCIGFGSAFIFTVVFGAVAQWFDKKKSTAIGIVSIGGGIGGVVWPLMFRSLFPKIGFAWTIRIVGFIAMLFLGCASILIKSRIPPRKVLTNIKSILTESFVFGDFLKDRIYTAYTVSLFISEFTFILVTNYITTYVINNGYTESEAFLVLITLNAVSIVGRFLPNYLGDKIGVFNMMLICSLFNALFMFVLWLPFGKNLNVMYGVASAQGLFALSVITLAPVCCARISKVEDFGKRYGTSYFLIALTNIFSLPIGGAIIGDGSGYHKLIIVVSCLQLLSSILWAITRTLAVGFDLRKKL